MRTTSIAFGVAALVVLGSSISVQAQGQEGNNGVRRRGTDNPKHALGAKQQKLRQEGLKAKLHGNAPGRVAQVAGGQYVELEQTRDDRIFAVLAEFGDTIHPAFGGTAGPRRNQIPEPDRRSNNHTIWQA